MSDSSKNFTGQTLKGKKFKGEDLSDSDFSNADLTNARFLNCNLTGAKFEKSKLIGAHFEEGTFQRVSLTGADGTRIRFKGVLLQQVNASGCSFENSAFQKATLEDCRFSDCHFTGSALSRVIIQNGSFETCGLDQVRSPDAKIVGTTFASSSFKRGDLVSWNVSDTRFSSCDFSESDLSGARLTRVSFHSCIFRQSEMIACDYEETTFDESEFTKAIIKYSRGLSEETLSMIRQKGGKVGLDLVRKASNFLFYSNFGRILLVVVVLGFVGYLAWRTFVPTSWSYEALRAEAAKARQQGDNEAVKQYNEIILEKYADRPSRITFALFELGQVLMEQQDFAHARPYLLRAYELNKEDPFAHPEIISALADSSVFLEDFEEAKKWYQMMLDGTSDDGLRTSARLGMIRVLRQTHQAEKALAMIEQELAGQAEDLQDSQFLDEKVGVLKELKQYEEALALLEKQLEADEPEQVRKAYFEIAMIERERGNQKRANEIFREMAKKFPEAQDFVDNSKIVAAQNLLAEGKNEEGEAMLKSAIEDAMMPQTQRHAKTSLAMHYLYTNRMDESERLFTELFKEIKRDDFDYPTLQINYAIVKRSKGKADEALSILNEVVESNPGNAALLRWAYSERAATFLNQGEAPKAIADFRLALQNTQPSEGRADLILNLIQTASLNGSQEDAIAIAKEYNSEIQEPQHRERLMDLMARTYINRGQFEDGIKMYDKLIDACEQGSSCTMRFTLEKIGIMAGNGMKEKALEEFKKVVAWDMTADIISDNCNIVSGLFPEVEGAEALYIEYYSKLTDAYRAGNITSENYFTTLNNLARIYFRKGETEKADALYQEVLARCENPWPVLQAYEDIFNNFMMTANYDAARETTEKLKTQINNDKGFLLAGVLLANLYAQTDRWEDAVDLLKKTLSTCQDDSDCCRVLDSLIQQYRIKDDRGEMRAIYDQWNEKVTDCWVLRDIKSELNIE